MAADPWKAMGIIDDIPGVAQNAQVFMPLVAYSAGRSDRGEKLAELASGTAGLAILPVTTTWASSALSLVAPSIGGPIGKLALLVGGVVLANEPNAWLRKSVFRSMRTLQGYDREKRRLEMGGDFRDTETSRAWRVAAVREMSSTHQAARTYLGREAVLMSR
jgi:hypothetical protein